jgi:asparaginyl-tRNA synthetase
LKSSPGLHPAALIEDLGSKERKAIFRIQTEVLKVMTKLLIDKGFYWILPVILAKSTDPLWPDSAASIEKRIELEIYGEKVKTMQSMIIHKRVLVSLALDRFFILSPNIRIETRQRAITGKHLYEFTQLEVEIAHAKMDDLFRLFEELIETSITSVIERCQDELKIIGREVSIPETPFRVFTLRELKEKYGQSYEESVSNDSTNPVWIIDIPREFYDYEDEKTGSWRNFDLILPEGYGEAISGAEREYDYEKIVRKLERDGLDKEEYELLLNLARERKLRPSAGAGLGVERFIRYICGADHVARVQPFPRIPGMVPKL